MKMGDLFRIDVYFTEYLLAVEIDEKSRTDRDEKTKSTKKKDLVVNLLELIRVKVIMQIMKLVEYKHSSVNLKTDN